MRRYEISYFPSNSTNSYTSRMREIYSKIGSVDDLVFKKELASLFKLNFRKKDLAVLNWLDNILLDSNGSLSYIGMFKVLLILFICKLKFKKVMYVQHNVYPHGTALSDIKIVKKYIKWIRSFCDISVSHSPVFSGGIYLPHPLYAIPDTKNKNIDNSKSNDYIIFGRIVSYKKIDEVIDVFPKNKKLIIAGTCEDDNYLKLLEGKIKDKGNIKIYSQYLTDNEARDLITKCKALLITHSDLDMIVSGSFFYTLSVGIKAYSIRTPFLDWAEKNFEGVVKNFSTLDEMMDFISLPDVRSTKLNEEIMEKVKLEFGDSKIEKELFNLLS